MKARARNISLNYVIDAAIERRRAESGESFTRTIERLWDEANGNLQTARRAVHDDLRDIRLEAATIQRALTSVHGPASLLESLRASTSRILTSLDEVTVDLARPETRRPPGEPGARPPAT